MKKILITSLLYLISSFSYGASETVGQVILSFGKNVAISADGTERVLKRKSEVFAEDTLFTGAKGRLQVRFTDGSRLSLKPGTEFQIEQYKFDKASPEEGKAFYKLIKGGMRTISGQIGKSDREAYKLDAVVATIGIRGTDFSVDKLGDKVSGSVNSGKINVAAKAGGNKDISAGRSFRLTGAQGSIVEFKTPADQQSEDSASESEEKQEDQEEQDEQQEEQESSESEEQSSDEQTTTEASDGETEPTAGTDEQSASSTDGSSAQNTAGTEIDASITVVTSTETSGNGIPATELSSEGAQQTVVSSPNPTGNGSAAPVGGTVVISFIEQDAAGTLKTSTGTVTVDSVSALTIDDTTGKDILTGIQYISTGSSSGDDCTPCTFESPSNIGNVTDVGTENVGGSQVTWGRWGNGFEIVDNDGVVNVKGSFHFIYADKLTNATQLAAVAAARSGQYIYGLTDAAYATAMEIETGNLGSLTLYNNDPTQPDGTYMIINWDNQSIDSFSLKGQAEDPVYGTTRYYSLTKQNSNSVSLNTVLNGGDLDLQGTCTGSGSDCETIVDMTGRASIELVGNNANGAITSYAAQGGPAAGGQKISITGAALLKDKGAVP